MRFFVPALSLALAVAALSGATPAFAQTCTCAGYAFRTEEPPPPLPDYDQPPLPEAGAMWTPGYWAWNGFDYYFVPGVWVRPPHQGLLWTPGYWTFVEGGYGFSPGYWGERVGFYGGVDYGYGYHGVGYRGGRWENGRFFYNRAANNLGRVEIVDVYEQPIVIESRRDRRVSFNGGPAGVTLRPTVEELRLAQDKHERPTLPQLAHARQAAMSPEAFRANNFGKPSIGAVARPAEFRKQEISPTKAGHDERIEEPREKIEPEAGPQKTVKPAPEIVPHHEKSTETIKIEPAKPEMKIERREDPKLRIERPAERNAPPRIEEKITAPKIEIRPELPRPLEKIIERKDEGRAPVKDAHPKEGEHRRHERECGKPGLPPCPK